MAILTLRLVKGSPLTHSEADSNFTNLNNELAAKLNSSSYTASDVLAKLLTVDGAGSGIDADLLDGQSSAYYTDIAARLGYTPVNRAGDTMTGTLTLPRYVNNAASAAGAFNDYSISGVIYGYIGDRTGVIGSGSGFTIRSQGALYLATGGANERVQIDTSGRVGIGMTPGFPLDVNGIGVFGTPTASSGNGGSVRFRLDTGAVRYTVGVLGGAAETAFSIYDNVAAAERWRMNTTGDSGINCTPVSTVPMRIQAAGFNDAGIELSRDSATRWRLQGYNRSAGSYVEFVSDALLHLWNLSGSAGAMRLDSVGLGIGQAAATRKLEINAIPALANQLNGLRLQMVGDTARGEFLLGTDASGVSFASMRTGVDGNAYITFFTGSGPTEQVRIDSTGRLLNTAAAGGLGYGTGSGGSVTQATSKSTGVTLNKSNGQITMNGASLAAGANVNFSLTNSLIASTDVVALSIGGGVGADGQYALLAHPAAGGCTISVRNVTAGALAEAVVLNFAVIKAVTS